MRDGVLGFLGKLSHSKVRIEICNEHRIVAEAASTVALARDASFARPVEEAGFAVFGDERYHAAEARGAGEGLQGLPLRDVTPAVR